jgi:demethylmenaquinone methyltransferase/2-methoxy-6-polyprenyl-1,4-benzoquinol methylase
LGKNLSVAWEANSTVLLSINSRAVRDPSSSPQGPEGETAFFGYRKVPVQEKVSYVLQHFHSIAGKYDFMNTILSCGLQFFWKRWAVKALRVQPGDRVIDVCGGTADLSILAAEAAGPEGKVILYDICRAMMEAGKPKVAQASLTGRIRYVQGDAELNSFLRNQFDCAMVGFGIRNLTHMERGLAEMVRVLKPGGRWMCLEFSLPTSLWFRVLYDFYSFHLMPLIGKLLTGSREAYVYLPESIRKFPSPEELTAYLRNIGLSRVNYQRLTNGIAVIYTGVKQ